MVVMVVIDGEYKTKTINRKYKDSNTRYREVIKYRSIDVNEYYKIEEGEIIEYYEKEEGKNEYKHAQQHLIGYVYLSLIDKAKNEDVIWIQGNKNDKDWLLAKSYSSSDWIRIEKKTAIKEFLKLLKKKYQLELEIKNSEIL